MCWCWHQRNIFKTHRVSAQTSSRHRRIIHNASRSSDDLAAIHYRVEHAWSQSVRQSKHHGAELHNMDASRNKRWRLPDSFAVGKKETFRNKLYTMHAWHSIETRIIKIQFTPTVVGVSTLLWVIVSISATDMDTENATWHVCSMPRFEKLRNHLGTFLPPHGFLQYSKLC